MKNVYGRSDNASSYQANFSVEALNFLYKNKGIKLVRYDFDEPCRERINATVRQLVLNV